MAFFEVDFAKIIKKLNFNLLLPVNLIMLPRCNDRLSYSNAAIAGGQKLVLDEL